MTCAGHALIAALLIALPWTAAVAQLPTPSPGPQQTPPPPIPAPRPAPTGLARWLDPSTAPFIPVPEIAVDPDSGTTLGLIPTKLYTNDKDQIDRIVAPDILHNPYFGFGMHMRVYDYPSEDEQWSVVTGIKQRVERAFDFEYERGRLRSNRWSFTGSLIYDRSGTPRFFGIGNQTPKQNETNYTDEQEAVQAQLGFNISRIWQVLYTGRIRFVNVLPGTLSGIASIEDRFPRVRGLHTNKELLNRVSIVYDTRDNVTVPSHGMRWVAYAGVASRGGLLNDSLYSETGVDASGYWPVFHHTILAAHTALRYLPSANDVPFWALSSIGGGQSVLGGEQPLRGYGEGRFYDRNSFSATVELRRRVYTLNAVSTQVELEVTPFVDLGRVFSRLSTSPVSRLHHVVGVGFRGLARPFVVGYVDVGYGTEGVAVFTGISYPF